MQAVAYSNPNKKQFPEGEKHVTSKCRAQQKLSKDYNSSGFSVNIEGEVTSPLTDAQAVVEEVKQFFDLAEESLDQQIERSQSTNALANHDEAPRSEARQTGNGRPAPQTNQARSANGNGNGHKDEAASNRQLQYLLSIGKRMKLTTVALEKEIGEILGTEVGLYDLSKRQAAICIDQLATPAASRA